MATIKGQNLRIFITKDSKTQAIAAATSCTVEIKADTEDVSTKDSTGDWAENAVTGKSWSFSTDSLVVDTDSDAINPALSLVGETVLVQFSAASSTKNRTPGDSVVSGSAIITSVSWTAANRQNSTVTMQATGTGELS